MRRKKIVRDTKETQIILALEVDGTGAYEIDTGSGFFNHMMELFTRHGRFDIAIDCKGDTDVDYHHTVEDIGIALGRAFREALGDKKGIYRYGSMLLPMDEALILTAVDIGGRSSVNFDVEIPAQKVGDFDTELTKEFFLALVRHAGITLHIRQLAGENAHHIIEGAFKSVARSLAAAVKIDSFAYLPVQDFGNAFSTFAAQNYGAGKIDRVKKGYRASLWTIGIWGLLITLIFIFTPTPIATIFFHEPSAIATAVSYLVIIGFSEAFLCIELTTIGAISGLGKTNLCSIISILFTSARIPLAMILGNTSMGLNGIWWAFSSTTIIKGIIFTGTFFWIIKKCPKNMNPPSSQA